MEREETRRVPLRNNDYCLEIRASGDKVSIALISNVFSRTVKVILLDKKEAREFCNVLGEILSHDEREDREKFIKELRQWQ